MNTAWERSGHALARMIVLAAVFALVPCSAARGQENPEQLKKAYDDALMQLRAAQERKNQLAAENDKLKQQIEALRGELAVAKAGVEEMKRVEAGYAEKTFTLRSHYVAWQQFMKVNPELTDRWRQFLGNNFLTASRPAPQDVLDRDWPLGLDASQ